MPALWTYPWTLHHIGIDEACNELAECGVDAINVASHYHSVRSMQARFPDELFRAFPGGCYFDPGDRFRDLDVEPSVNSVGSWDDPLAEVVAGAQAHGLEVNGWTVCLHNTRLGATNPPYRIESAFGDAHDHSLCPSHPEVRAYFAAVVAAVRERGVDEISLESIGFPSAFHHGAAYGHDKRQAVTSPRETALLSQCFCDGCRRAAASHHVDFAEARHRVQELAGECLHDPTVDPPSLPQLLDQNPVLDDLMEFRATVVDQFLDAVSDAAGRTPLNYYVMESFGSEPSALPLAGVRPELLERHLDRVTGLCYVPDAETAQAHLSDLQSAVDVPVDAGITLDPEVVDSRRQLSGLVDSIRSQTDGSISVYHHSLLTDTHLAWLRDVFADGS